MLTYAVQSGVIEYHDGSFDSVMTRTCSNEDSAVLYCVLQRCVLFFEEKKILQ